MPKISVLMSAYNAEKTIEVAILSILAQDFSDFEFIIVNDGSDDMTEDIILAYKKLDSRIVSISNDVNQGLIYSLNCGLEKCTGEWVARMDADDISMPNRFSVQLKALEESDVKVLGSYAINYHDHEFGSILKVPHANDQIKKHLLFNSAFINPTVMIKRDIFNVASYSANYQLAEDYDLYAQISHLGLRMGNVDEILLCYRRHELQLTKSKSEMILRNKISISQRCILELLRKNTSISRVFDNSFMPAKNFLDFSLAIDLLSHFGIRIYSKHVVGLFLECFGRRKWTEIFAAVSCSGNVPIQLFLVLIYCINFLINLNKISNLINPKSIASTSETFRRYVLSLESKKIFHYTLK